jgi:hypothetical protein
LNRIIITAEHTIVKSFFNFYIPYKIPDATSQFKLTLKIN